MTESDGKSRELRALRVRIDAVDDAIQDLLIERAALVEDVARLKRNDHLPPFLPGREAQILRRLISRHRGSFPPEALVRIWQEIMGAGVAVQAELSVAFCGACGDLARDYFGCLVPMLELDSADEVIAAVRDGRVRAGVLPLGEEERAPWWLALGDAGAGRPNVVARLPFGACSEASPVRDAFVIAAMEADASGDDCTLVAIAAPVPLAISRITDAFLAMKLDCAPLAQREQNRSGAVLVEVGTMLAAGDERMRRGLAPLGGNVRATWLGVYARPLADDALRSGPIG